ncbi:MAG: hypothetical protein LBO72_02730 [Helicobacteraceae bacterium]|nr:hypothetical protein [Helicobacteraceae bacterium]
MLNEFLTVKARNDKTRAALEDFTNDLRFARKFLAFYAAQLAKSENV